MRTADLRILLYYYCSRRITILFIPRSGKQAVLAVVVRYCPCLVVGRSRRRPLARLCC